MENIRSGDAKVYALKQEVQRSLMRLKTNGYRLRLGRIEYISRVERQIADGEKFLNMLEQPPYSSCKTVDELKQRISRKRNRLKQALVKFDPNTEGHQISIFEIIDDVPEVERKAREATVCAMKEEIHWLHKCLGICKNKDYFK